MGKPLKESNRYFRDPRLREHFITKSLIAAQEQEGIEISDSEAREAYYIASEEERPAFFDLAKFQGNKGQKDLREDMFVRSINGESGSVRFDVARQDFASVEGAPLAYSQMSIAAKLFRDHLSLSPNFATTKQGLTTVDDSRFLRFSWEVSKEEIGKERGWTRIAKGGEFCRFYFDFNRLVLWRDNGKALKDFILEREGSITKRVYSQAYYFRQSICWPRRTQRGLNVRWLPEGYIFTDKNPCVFALDDSDLLWMLGVLNSELVDYLIRALTSFGSYEEGAVRRLPIVRPKSFISHNISELVDAIYKKKASWDIGNEISTIFSKPWLLLDLNAISGKPIAERLQCLLDYESNEDSNLQELYFELNETIYKLYDVPKSVQQEIHNALGDRPPELIWPQMEGKVAEQKRMEHVWRLLSYFVKKILEDDEDGIVFLNAPTNTLSLLERVRQEISHFFSEQNVNQSEIEIVNELKNKVKGYRQVNGLQSWLENVYFNYHVALYRKRPIFWHIASNQSPNPTAFSVIVHYHRFDKNAMAKLRSHFLRDAMEQFRREAALANQEGRVDDSLELQNKLEEVEALDQRLKRVQEGYFEGEEGGDTDYRILTPWKSPSERPQGWDPDLDDGVAVNIAPLQKAGVLRIGKVI